MVANDATVGAGTAFVCSTVICQTQEAAHPRPALEAVIVGDHGCRCIYCWGLRMYRVVKLLSIVGTSAIATFFSSVIESTDDWQVRSGACIKAYLAGHLERPWLGVHLACCHHRRQPFTPLHGNEKI